MPFQMNETVSLHMLNEDKIHLGSNSDACTTFGAAIAPGTAFVQLLLLKNDFTCMYNTEITVKTVTSPHPYPR